MQLTLDGSSDSFEKYSGLRPIFSYYGGKQIIAKNILSILPKHTCYVEPFCGGGAVFWAKGTRAGAYNEVLNDTNSDIVNLFRVLRDEEMRSRFIEQLKLTPYSREEYYQLRTWEPEDPVDRAMKFYYIINASFGNILNSGFSASVSRSEGKKYRTRLNNLIDNIDIYIDRLKNVIIEHLDAIKCIRAYDTIDTLFYVDPPYINTDKGHYKGYGVDDYLNLIECLKNIKGSFILSGYPNEYAPKDWYYIDIKTTCRMNRQFKNAEKARVERLWIKSR